MNTAPFPYDDPRDEVPPAPTPDETAAQLAEDLAHRAQTELHTQLILAALPTLITLSIGRSDWDRHEWAADQAVEYADAVIKKLDKLIS